ncbi:hypothetical protein NKJ73_32060 [Mesorhizobium sp. M0074]|uniref:hypothetical protein n=1 Tax=Mesorhizobium sp. M0074 TaxID=2956869 RepID=UPI00333D4F30
MFITAEMDYSLGNPLTDPLLTSNGDQAWYGWPKNEEYEALREKWANGATLEKRKALARKMQRIWWGFVGDVRLGKYIAPIARRKTLTGLIGVPAIVPMWNMPEPKWQSTSFDWFRPSPSWRMVGTFVFC